MNGHVDNNGFWPVSMLYLTLVHDEKKVLNISSSNITLSKTRTFSHDLKGDVCHRQLSWVLPSCKFKHLLSMSCGNTIKTGRLAASVPGCLTCMSSNSRDTKTESSGIQCSSKVLKHVYGFFILVMSPASVQFNDNSLSVVDSS